MPSETSAPRLRRPEPELETVPFARTTRKTVERLAPFCQMRLPPNTPNVPLVSKTNSKILYFIQAVDTSMLVAQIGYRLASDAATLCDPFAASSSLTINGNGRMFVAPTPETLQMMAAHGHGHALKTSEAFRDVQQEIYKIAAVTKDSDVIVFVPPDPQQPTALRKTLKEVGSDLVANLTLLNQFSRSMLDLTSWWEWLEEELLAPDSTLLPRLDQRDAELYARWSKIKGGYLDYYNAIRVVYARYPQLLTTSSTAWQSLSSVPPPPSSPGSSWDGSFQDLGVTAVASDEEFPGRKAEESGNTTEALLPPPLGSAQEKEKKRGKVKGVKTVIVKAFVGRIRLANVFGRQSDDEGGPARKEKKKGKGMTGKETEKAQQDQGGERPIDAQIPAPERQEALILPPKETETIDDRRNTHSLGVPSSAPISEDPKETKVEKGKGRVARALALLRKALARLGCHNSQVDDSMVW